MIEDWPLVGRQEESGVIGRCLSRRQGVLVSGPAGVGKSRLIQQSAAEAVAAGWAAIHLSISSGLGDIPLASLRAAVDFPGHPHNLSELADAVLEGVRLMGQGRPLLLCVHQAHLLDQASAGLLHRLAAQQDAVLLLTVRAVEPGSGSGPRLADLTALWRDGFVERLDLQALGRGDVEELVRAVLPAEVEDGAVQGLWELTEGNVLFLREVLRHGLESGQLRTVGGQWVWSGGWDTGGQLRTLEAMVAERLGGIGPAERTLLELLAVAEPLGYELLKGLTGAGAVGALERRRMIVVESSRRRLELRTAHPLYAEIINATLSTARASQIRGLLADRLIALGARRRRDRLLLASWVLEEGTAVDPVTLRYAAQASLGFVGRALAREVATLLPEAAPAEPGHPVRDRPSGQQTGGHPIPGPDTDLAVPLARAAWEAGGNVVDGVLLARSLTSSGEIDEAEAVLDQLRTGVPTRATQTRLVRAEAELQFWGRNRPDQALTTLQGAKRPGPHADETAGRIQLLITEAGIHLNLGRPAHAVAAITSAYPDAESWTNSPLAPTYAAALALLGRCEEAIAVVDVALPRARERGWSTLAPAQLLLARTGAVGRAGRLEEARALAEGCHQVALSSNSPDGAAVFATVTGTLLLLEGRPVSATRVLLEADSFLRQRDVLGYRPWGLSVLSRARALAGDEPGAAEALAGAEAASPLRRYFTSELHLARAAVRELQGQTAAALDAASAAVEVAAEAEMVVDEALALDVLLRLGPTAEVAARLSALPGRTDSKLVPLLADHANFLLDGAPAGLLGCSERFEAMGAAVMAAEGAAAAAMALNRADQVREAEVAGRRAERLAAGCEGVRGPFLTALTAPHS